MTQQIREIASRNYPVSDAELLNASYAQDLQKARKLLESIRDAKSIADIKECFKKSNISPNFYLQNQNAPLYGKDYIESVSTIGGALFNIALCIVRNDSPLEDFPRTKAYRLLIPSVQNDCSIEGEDLGAPKELIVTTDVHGLLVIREIVNSAKKSDRKMPTNPYDKDRPLDSTEMQQIQFKDEKAYDQLKALQEHQGAWLSPLTLEVLIYVLEVTRSVEWHPDKEGEPGVVKSFEKRFEGAEKNPHFKSIYDHDYVPQMQAGTVDKEHDSTPKETQHLGGCFFYFLKYFDTLPDEERRAFRNIKNRFGTVIHERLTKIGANQCLSMASSAIADFVVCAVSAERAAKLGPNLKRDYEASKKGVYAHLVRPLPVSPESEAFDPELHFAAILETTKKADAKKAVVSTGVSVSSSSSNQPVPPPQVSSSVSSSSQPHVDAKSQPLASLPGSSEAKGDAVPFEALPLSSSAFWKRFAILTVLSLGIFPIMYVLNKLSIKVVKTCLPFFERMFREGKGVFGELNRGVHDYDPLSIVMTLLFGAFQGLCWILEKSFKALETISLALLSPIETYRNIRQESHGKAYLFVFAVAVAFATLFIFAAPAFAGVSGLILGMQLSSIPVFGTLGAFFSGAIIQPLLALMGISVQGALVVEVATISSMVLASGMAVHLYNGIEKMRLPSVPEPRNQSAEVEADVLPRNGSIRVSNSPYNDSKMNPPPGTGLGGGDAKGEEKAHASVSSRFADSNSVSSQKIVSSSHPVWDGEDTDNSDEEISVKWENSQPGSSIIRQRVDVPEVGSGNRDAKGEAPVRFTGFTPNFNYAPSASSQPPVQVLGQVRMREEVVVGVSGPALRST